MSSVSVNKLIEDFEKLSIGDKEYTIDVIKKQLVETKRNAVAKRAKEARANRKKGLVKSGSVEELFKDLESD